ncbi:MAG: glycosyltransferase [Saccharospirillaceae bacterium]|nr:glycosyltransferase [Saccharospirillaceae bacterium]
MNKFSNKNCTVLVVLLSNTIGGAEKRYTNLFSYLCANGQYNYTIIMNKTIYSKLIETDLNMSRLNISVVGIDLTRWLLRSNNNISKALNKTIRFYDKQLSYYQMQRHIRKYKPAVVHGILKGIDFLTSVKRKNFLTVISYVSCDGSVLKTHKKLLSEADGVDVLAPYMAKLLVNNGATEGENLYPAPCSFTDYSIFISKSKKNKVIYLARMEPNKSPFLFIDMVKEIPREIQCQFEFVMYGIGSLLQDVERYGSELVKSGVLKIEGHLEKTSVILSESLVFIQPTVSEAHGTQSLLEAMASANAVVTTDIPGIELIVTNEVGYRASLDAKSFAEKLIYLLSDVDKTVEMGKRGAALVRREQTVSLYANHIENIYDKLVKK